MAAALTDWEQASRQAISFYTWVRPKDPRSCWLAEGTAGYSAKHQLGAQKKAPLKDQL